VLDGSSVGNTFDVTGWTNNNLTINGGGGTNTVIAEAPGGGTTTLTNNSITFNNSSRVIILSSIQDATLNGDSGGITFDVTGWTAGNVTLNGSGNNNTVEAQADKAGKFTVTTNSIAFDGTDNSSRVITVNNYIQNIVLDGSSSGNTFDLLSWQGGNLNLTFVGTAVFANNTNTFIFNPITSSQTVNAAVVGGGNDTLNLSSFPTNTGNALTIPDNNSQTISLQSDLILILSGIKHLSTGTGASPQSILQPPALGASVSANSANTTGSPSSATSTTLLLTNAWCELDATSAGLDKWGFATQQDVEPGTLLLKPAESKWDRGQFPCDNLPLGGNSISFDSSDGLDAVLYGQLFSTNNHSSDSNLL
jgi:hypothetical protein